MSDEQSGGQSLDSKSHRLRSHSSREVLTGWKWMAVSNVVIVLMFAGPALLFQILQRDFSSPTIFVAWEAHVGGFIAGLFLMDLMSSKGWPDAWRGGFLDSVDALEGPEARRVN